MIQITLRAARINCGYTLKEVAQLLHKNIDTISKFEIDSSNIPWDLLESLMNLYDMSVDNIFFGKQSDFIGQKKQRAVSIA